MTSRKRDAIFGRMSSDMKDRPSLTQSLQALVREQAYRTADFEAWEIEMRFDVPQDAIAYMEGEA